MNALSQLIVMLQTFKDKCNASRYLVYLPHFISLKCMCFYYTDVLQSDCDKNWTKFAHSKL